MPFDGGRLKLICVAFVTCKNEFTNAHHAVVKNGVFIIYNIFLY